MDMKELCSSTVAKKKKVNLYYCYYYYYSYYKPSALIAIGGICQTAPGQVDKQPHTTHMLSTSCGFGFYHKPKEGLSLTKGT